MGISPDMKCSFLGWLTSQSMLYGPIDIAFNGAGKMYSLDDWQLSILLGKGFVCFNCT